MACDAAVGVGDADSQAEASSYSHAGRIRRSCTRVMAHPRPPSRKTMMRHRIAIEFTSRQTGRLVCAGHFIDPPYLALLK